MELGFGLLYWGRTCALAVLYGLAFGLQYGVVGYGSERIDWFALPVFKDDSKPTPKEDSLICVDADVGGMGMVIPTTIIWLFFVAQTLWALKLGGGRCRTTTVAYTALLLAAAFATDMWIQIVMGKLSFGDAVTGLVCMDLYYQHFISLSLSRKHYLSSLFYTYVSVFISAYIYVVIFIVAAMMSKHTADMKSGCPIAFACWGVFRYGKPTPYIYFLYTALRFSGFWTSLANGSLLWMSQSVRITRDIPPPLVGNNINLEAQNERAQSIDDLAADDDTARLLGPRQPNQVPPGSIELRQIFRPTAARTIQHDVESLVALPEVVYTVAGTGPFVFAPFLIAVTHQWIACFAFHAQRSISSFGQILTIVGACLAILKDVYDSWATDASNETTRTCSFRIAVWLGRYGSYFNPPEMMCVFVVWFGGIVAGWIGGIWAAVVAFCSAEP
ncbi:hypothetical protein BJ508DRAFT_309528 [Ascobolus immersus RN42]|uniref:Uncharacterized protein n=1 Tax=Ascobolus immersus RN42 TaxID=1160509 RepID=A0A3N4HWI6_ASCIM|nr:hypothetical protein BJ508DRAFT_309528 [Ascobolus immersus RN42]